METINGKAIAQEIIDELRQKPKIKKFLAAFLVGNDPASISFLKQKEKTASELGIDFRLYRYPENATSDELRKEIGRVASRKTCGGALVQLPLPKIVNAQYVLNVIPREKDIDVLGERALGAFYVGRSPALPPAVGATEHILTIVKCQLSNVKVAVLGRGALVGKPIAVWLMGQVAELAVFTSKTEKTAEKLKNYDLIITGIGKAGIIKPENLKDGAGVIDFGYELKYGSLYGDLDITEPTTANKQQTNNKATERPSSLSSPSPSPSPSYNLQSHKDWDLRPTTYNLSFYTPTPHGTGPILVAKLLENFYILNTT